MKMKMKLMIPVSALAVMGCFTLTQLKGESEWNPAGFMAKPVALTDDAVVNLFNRSVVDRLNTQEKRRELFSRSAPVPSSYELGEVSKDKADEVRQFEIQQVRSTSYKKKVKKMILELRYSEKDKKAEAKDGEKWVALENHPVIKLLPKPPEEAKVG